jgi:hypothetical protein
MPAATAFYCLLPPLNPHPLPSPPPHLDQVCGGGHGDADRARREARRNLEVQRHVADVVLSDDDGLDLGVGWWGGVGGGGWGGGGWGGGLGGLGGDSLGSRGARAAASGLGRRVPSAAVPPVSPRRAHRLIQADAQAAVHDLPVQA